MAKPIRIGIIGLSASMSWAVVAHLPYLRDSAKYTITAICNTSAESSRAAVKAHGLPEATKTYGSPQELADDPDVDLVLCSNNVAYHYDSVLPAVKAGKDVYCEWPLGRNLAEAEELNAIAKEKGCRTMVGLQGVQSPIVAKLKEIIGQGKIGNVLSSTFVGPSLFGGPQEQENKEYFLKADVGGNMVTIFFGHNIATIVETLGELKSFNSILDIKVPTAELTDKPTSDPSRKVVRTIKRETHDQILLQGHFDSGALFSYHLRGGKAIGPGEGLDWRIQGDKGELSVTASGTWLQCGYADSKIRLFDNQTEKLEEVPIPEDEWAGLPLPAHNVARLYEAFADGKTDGFSDWSDAVRRHKLIDEMYSRERAAKQDQTAEYRN